MDASKKGQEGGEQKEGFSASGFKLSWSSGFLGLGTTKNENYFAIGWGYAGKESGNVTVK